MASDHSSYSSSSDLFHLKWNDFQKNVSNQFEKLREEEDLVDITFACEGKKIGAHKLILFACSPYLRNLLKDNPCQHPVFYMNDVKFEVLKAILEYIYLGEVQIKNDCLNDFIKIADSLQIRGLAHNKDQIASNGTQITNPMDVIEGIGVRKKRSSNDTECLVGDKKLKSVDNNSIRVDRTLPSPGNDLLKQQQLHSNTNIEPKIENVDYTQPSYYSLNTNQNDLSGRFEQPGTSQQPAREYKTDMEPWVDKPNQDNLNASGDGKCRWKNKMNCLAPHPCPVCSRVYSNISNLRQHMRLIHNPTAVCCPFCQKNFNSELYLKRHCSSFHGNLTHQNEASVDKTVATNAWNAYPNAAEGPTQNTAQ